MRDMTAEELKEAEDWEIIRYCGDNAQRWANAFDAIHSGKSLDRQTMVGWFANAIEAASDIHVPAARKAALEDAYEIAEKNSAWLVANQIAALAESEKP